MSDGAAIAQLIQPAQQPSTEKPGRSSKARRRRKLKLLKKKEIELASPNQLIIDKPPPTDVATSRQEQPSIDPSMTNVSGSHLRPHLVNGGANGETSLPEDGGIDISCGNDTMIVPEEAGTSILQLEAGIRTQRVSCLIAILLSVCLIL